MAGLEEVRNVLHVIRARLYHNYLEYGGKFIAHTKTDKTLNVNQICAEAVTRGGSSLNYDTMVDAVNAYFDEAFYQLADGFSVENDYFSIHPKIGGTFDHTDAKPDKKKNPVEFTFRKRQKLRDIISRITVEIEDVVENLAYIAEVLDVASGTVDERLTSGSVLTVLGRRIKITGNDPSCGLYLVNVADGSTIKVIGNLVDNQRNRISTQLPVLAPGTYRIRILTQFSGGGTFLKEPHHIDSMVDLAVS
ncbi:MAG: DUF4469 domain-containing protein [Treponema sp.]|jgi:hypothetical protein|nr:DUF4469 domain-containing protein [Treponema sp.]